MKDLKCKTLSSKYLCKKPWLTVRKDKIQLANGKINPAYYVLEYPDWINVIAETEDGKIIIEKQFRQGTKEISTEICSGVIEKYETPLQAAKRELKEETGYVSDEWRATSVLHPNSSTSNNSVHSFTCKNARKVSEQHLDETEDVIFELKDKKEVFEMLKDGIFNQTSGAAALWRYFYYQNKKK